MKRFTFEVEDRVTRCVVVIADSQEEAFEKLEDWDIESEWEQGCDVDFETATLVEEEPI